MFQSDTLANKKILITGGGSGLGLAIARGAAELGARVVLCGRTEEKLRQAANSFPKSEGVETITCDVREPESVEEMFSNIWPLDGLVNNAAGNFYSCSEDLTPNGFRTVVDIVLHGTFLCSHAFGSRAIREERGGSILNIVTTYADSGSMFVLPSACAKAGVLTMTKSLGVEWASYGIRVNAIAPGPIPTEGAWERLVPSADIEKKMKEAIPMRRFGTEEELSQLASFLLSDMSSYITAESIAMDGGEGLQGSGFNLLDQMVPREELRKLFYSMKSSKK
ncbi:SDR family oxidoreductase [bacterium]|nr:SDR family oxidoreductase [bacterium]